MKSSRPEEVWIEEPALSTCISWGLEDCGIRRCPCSRCGGISPERIASVELVGKINFRGKCEAIVTADAL